MTSSQNPTMEEIREAIRKGRERVASKTTYKIPEEAFRRCMTCNAPVEMFVKLFSDQDELVPCMCECDKEVQQQEIAAEQLQDRLIRIQRNRDEGITDGKYAKYTFDVDRDQKSEASRISRKYVENFAEMAANNVGLLYSGNVGTGKTFYACCIGNALLDKGYRVGITTLADAISRIFSAKDKAGELRRIQSFDLLIIDDFGTERDSEYAREQIFSIIDARSRAGKPTIFTTNLSRQFLESAKQLQDQRVFDRVLEMAPVTVVLNGQNRRDEEKQIKVQKAVSALLGDG